MFDNKYIPRYFLQTIINTTLNATSNAPNNEITTYPHIGTSFTDVVFCTKMICFSVVFFFLRASAKRKNKYKNMVFTFWQRLEK